MLKRFALLGVAVIGMGLLIGTCSKKSPTGPDDGDSGPTVETYSYTSTGSTITITVPEHIDTIRYCNDSDLITDYDTVPLGFIGWLYDISGTALTIVHGNDTAVYSRSGSGSGLIGEWVRNGTDDDFPVRLTFAATTVSLVYQPCFADYFVEYEWAIDSPYYAVTLQRVSCTQVRLSGDSTGEVATITWNGVGDMTTSSSNAAHATHTRYVNPLSCPNEDYPYWYYNEFLDDNFIQGPAAKRAVVSTGVQVKRGSLFR